MPQKLLALGMRGDAVGAVQRALGTKGLSVPASEANLQFFGPKTREALQVFQQSQGLPVTGVVDAATQAALDDPYLQPAERGAALSKSKLAALASQKFTDQTMRLGISGEMAVARLPGHLDVFWVGEDGGIWTQWWDENANWDMHAPSPIARNFVVPASQGSPLTAVSRLPRHLDVFWVADDGAIWTQWWDENANWDQHNPFRIAGSLSVGVRTNSRIGAVARLSGHLDVFWAGEDGKIWTQWWDENANWGQHDPFWIALSFPAGVRSDSPVVAVARASGHLDVFWVGNDDAIWTQWWDERADWGTHDARPITSPGSVRARSSIAAVARLPGHLDVFWVGEDGAIWTNWWDENADWNAHAPFPISSNFQVPARQDSPLTAVSRFPGHLDVFWVGADAAVWTQWWDENADWGQHEPFPISWLFPVGAGSPLGAVARLPGHLDVFWAGNDGAIWTQWWDDNANWDRHDPFIIASGEAHLPSITDYRNYLLNIWFSISRDVPDQRPGSPEVIAVQRLKDRFHQNFITEENTPEPANDIAVRTLTAILIAAPGVTHGFGIRPGDIQPQGNRASREYLDYLISLTRLSENELSLRYRIDLSRPDSVTSTEVAENIATFQRFFRDGFQDLDEPDSIVPSHLRPKTDGRGMPPFYLQYDEWVAQKAPFFAENYFLIRYTWGTQQLERGGGLRAKLDADQRKYPADAAIRPDPAGYPGAQQAWEWIAVLLEAEDTMNAGHAAFNQGEYARANALYLDAEAKAWTAVNTADPFGDAELLFSARRAMPAGSDNALLALQNVFVVSTSPIPPTIPGQFWKSMEDWRVLESPRLRAGLVYLLGYVLPICKADTLEQRGDFASAVQARLTLYGGLQVEGLAGEGYRMGTAAMVAEADRDTSTPYYLGLEVDGPGSGKTLWQVGSLPYATALGWPMPYTYIGIEYVGPWIVGKLHAVDIATARLRQGRALLEWADALYRTDDAASIARARELYKGALWLQGETPPVFPSWRAPVRIPLPRPVNPEIQSERRRAERGLYQIDAGLNYYGYTLSLVPLQRYRTLKDAADRFTSFAKSAQQDFIAYIGNIEAAIQENLRNANLLAKATLQAQLAGEQAAIALDGVKVAQLQLNQVNAAIAAKEKEIADHDSLFSQFSDFASGVVKAVKDVPDDTKSSVLDGVKKVFSDGAIGSVHQMAGEGFLGLGEAGSVVAGFGIFAYAGYTSLSSMADAANKRMSDLATLQNVSLPTATAQLDAKQHEVRIAGLQQQIAQADAHLAADLIAFQAQRLLSAEFWGNLAALTKRLLRRYLELGARTAWLAERALAYEQDRELRVVRLDYYPLGSQFVSGADLLQADVAELEASRLAGLQETVPIKHTYSMARDFPLEFAKLKSSGACIFQTTEAPFRQAYPGTYGYRIQAVTPTLNSVALTTPARGLLANPGVSSISALYDRDAVLTVVPHTSARPPDAMPISEFRLRNDAQVYGLPDETLLAFEGVGIDTLWRFDFPAIANPNGLDAIVDILLTVDVRARYSTALHTNDLGVRIFNVNRLVLVSARGHQTKQLEALRSGAPNVELTFDMGSLGLPAAESNRKVTNLVLLAAFSRPAVLTAMLHSAGLPAGKSIALTDGVALSIAPPLHNSQAPQPPPLNAFVGENATQPFRLTIKKADNQQVDFATLADVVLGIDYVANFGG